MALVSIPSLAGQTARQQSVVTPIVTKESRFNPLISGADRAAAAKPAAKRAATNVSIPSLAGQTARLNALKRRLGRFSPVSIPSLAGQTARLRGRI